MVILSTILPQIGQVRKWGIQNMIDLKQRLLMGNACYPSPERRSSKGTSFTNKDTRLTVENWSAVSSSCASPRGLSHTPPSSAARSTPCVWGTTTWTGTALSPQPTSWPACPPSSSAMRKTCPAPCSLPPTDSQSPPAPPAPPVRSQTRASKSTVPRRVPA